MSSCQNTAFEVPKEKRKPQTCCFCKNHGLLIMKKDHKNRCQYRECECNLCMGTKDRQLYSAREKKKHYPTSKKIQNEKKVEGRQRKEQKCRKCLNHEIIVSMRDHKKNCPYRTCPCQDCESTLYRRKHVTNEARTKRQREKNNQCEIKAEEIEIEEIFSPTPSYTTCNEMEVDFLSPRSHDTGYDSATYERSPIHFPSEVNSEDLPPFNYLLGTTPEITYHAQANLFISFCEESFDQKLLRNSQTIQSLPDLKGQLTSL